MQMMSPGMPVTAESLKQDPLLLFPRYAMQLATPSQQDIEMEQGFATIHHEQGISRLFVLQLTQSPYNIDYQEQTSTWIEQTKQKLAAMGLKSHWTGTILFFKFWYAIGQTGNLNHWCWLDTGLNFSGLVRLSLIATFGDRVYCSFDWKLCGVCSHTLGVW